MKPRKAATLAALRKAATLAALTHGAANNQVQPDKVKRLTCVS